jgi:tetratricopeptide (TPR) repeat protein
VKIGAPKTTQKLPLIYGPLISYQITQAFKPSYSAFYMVDTNVKIDPKHTFGQNDTLSSFFSIDRNGYKDAINVQMDVKSTDENSTYQKSYAVDFSDSENFRNVIQALEKMVYGNYMLSVKLLAADNNVLTEKSIEFQVSPMSSVPHPPIAGKTLKKQHHFIFYMMIAQQYQNLGKLDAAKREYEKAYKMNSVFPQLLKSYASLLFQEKQYQKVLSVIKKLEGQEKEAFDFYTLQGRAYYYLDRFEDAVTSLLKANKIYDSDILVLNTLGFSFARLGNREEAVKALTASLKINPEQQDIARVLEGLKTKKTNNDVKKKE